MKKQADGRYKSKIVIGHDKNGKPIRKFAAGYTKKEFEESKAELKRQYITGNTEAVRRDVLFGDFARSWYQDYKRPSLKAAGRSLYSSILDANLIPVFGKRQLRAITPGDLQSFLNDIAEKYSKSTVGHILMTLHQIFALATAQYVIDRDPTLTLVRPSAKFGERRALTDAEKAAALHVARTHELGLLWMILYYTGARLGEVLGLQWRDVNFKTSELSIRRDIDYKQKGDQVGTLKSEHSERTIPVASELLDALKAARGISSAYIISAPRSGGYLPQSTAKRHIDVLRRAMYEFDPSIEHEDSPLYKSKNAQRAEKNKIREIPQVSIITPHYFRHNFATLCYYNGVDVLTAAAWLGHADPTTIMKIYAHLDKTRGVRSPEKINAIFDAATPRNL